MNTTDLTLIMTRLFNRFGLPLVFSTLLLIGCGSSSDTPSFQKTPIDEFTKQYSDAQSYSVILYDMDFDQTKEEYKHQYRILYTPANKDTIVEKTTDWTTVSADFFDKNVDNMGMELVSKAEDGKVTKTAAPPGYGSYVGNSKYGEWKQSNGSSFWAFYGQYAFMSSMLHMATYPIYASSYNSYRRDYHGRRPYYGTTNSGGRSLYGTKGVSTRNNSRWASKPASFKQNVRSKVKQSASRQRSAFKRSRSSGRSSSPFRSRSRGFGK